MCKWVDAVNDVVLKICMEYGALLEDVKSFEIFVPAVWILEAKHALFIRGIGSEVAFDEKATGDLAWEWMKMVIWLLDGRLR